jgi:ribosome-binding protein aMBF1 (putative translation factor)
MSRAIYVVRSEPGPVRISVATRLNARLSILRASSAVPLHVAYAAKTDGDAFALKRRAHAILAKRPIRGQWFKVSAQDAVAAVLQAAKELGLALSPAGLSPSREEKAETAQHKRALAHERRRALDALGLVTIQQFKAARALLGWTQDRFADASGISRPTIRRMELEHVGHRKRRCSRLNERSKR